MFFIFNLCAFLSCYTSNFWKVSLDQGRDVCGTFTVGPTATAAVLQRRLSANLPQTLISPPGNAQQRAWTSSSIQVSNLLKGGRTRTETSFTNTRKIKCDEIKTKKGTYTWFVMDLYVIL